MSANLIDFVIALTPFEGVACAHHRRTGRGMAPSRFVARPGAGLAPMLAVRAGMAGAPWGFVAAALMPPPVAAADLKQPLAELQVARPGCRARVTSADDAGAEFSRHCTSPPAALPRFRTPPARPCDQVCGRGRCRRHPQGQQAGAG